MQRGTGMHRGGGEGKAVGGASSGRRRLREAPELHCTCGASSALLRSGALSHGRPALPPPGAASSSSADARLVRVALGVVGGVVVPFVLRVVLLGQLPGQSRWSSSCQAVEGQLAQLVEGPVGTVLAARTPAPHPEKVRRAVGRFRVSPSGSRTLIDVGACCGPGLSSW